MDVMEAFERMPFNDHLGIELLEAEDGRAVGRLGLQQFDAEMVVERHPLERLHYVHGRRW